MREIVIQANDAGQRLDRFLKKYLAQAPLSAIYKAVRKDVKVDGRRCREDFLLEEGQLLQLYLSDEQIDAWSAKRKPHRAKRQFRIVYEDENILIANKPFGLLVHGDRTEKKDTLANQVTDYLIESGSYDPRSEKSFTPSPAHRLDRNTTGVVVFGKNAEALRELARVFREDGLVTKSYYTIVHGRLEEAQHLKGKLLKDEARNVGRVLPLDDERGKYIETVVKPLDWSKGAFGKGSKARGYTFVAVDLITGRSHQIRAHLASIGHPLAGDSKYGGRTVHMEGAEFVPGSSTQALHAYKVTFTGAQGCLAYLNGMSYTAELPQAWEALQKGLFGKVIVESEQREY